LPLKLPGYLLVPDNGAWKASKEKGELEKVRVIAWIKRREKTQTRRIATSPGRPLPSVKDADLQKEGKRKERTREASRGKV